ncbi:MULTISPECIES: hypothetical protein, partial [unclassified Pseudomonas]|uniref:hypothetical protein n=1 Tax=unclassified Pseudomonas TaxID=196821 RepID=UPI001CA464A1
SCFDDLKLTLSKSFNSLNLKEFSVSTAPEVGRIIGRWNSESSAMFALFARSSKTNPQLDAHYIAQP